MERPFCENSTVTNENPSLKQGIELVTEHILGNKVFKIAYVDFSNLDKDGASSVFLVFINEICAENLTLCKLILDMEEINMISEEDIKLLVSKVFIEPATAYKALKFLVKSIKGKHLEISEGILNNILVMFQKYYPIHKSVEDGCKDIVDWLLGLNKNNSGEDINAKEIKMDLNMKNDKSETLLHIAVKKSNLDLTKYFLEKGCTVDCADIDGNTPLHVAVANNWIDGVQMLTDICVDNDSSKCCFSRLNAKGFSPFHDAIDRGHWRLLDFFNYERCNLILKTLSLDNPFHLAVRSIENEGLSALLEWVHNDDLVQLNSDGLTPLHVAAQLGHINHIKKLLKYNVDVDVLSRDGNTPLHFAALNGHTECCIKLIAKGASLKSVNSSGESILDTMSQNGSHSLINLLLEKFPNMDKEKLVFYASTKGHERTVLEIVKREIETNSDFLINLRSPYTLNSLLDVAAQSGQIKIIKLLLANGMSVNTSSSHGMVPLHWAVKSQNLECVNFILKHNADVNVQTKWGLSALQIAVAKENVNITRLLLKHNADVNLPSYDGWSAMQRAVFAGIEQQVDLLLSLKEINLKHKICSGLTPLHIAVMKNKIGIVEQLLSNQPDLNAKDTSGNTPLHKAVNSDASDIALAIMNNGADINVTNNLGLTPLHIAVQRENKVIIKELISKGADVNKNDHYQRTARVLSLKSSDIRTLLFQNHLSDLEKC